MNLGTKLFTWLHGELVGSDEFGNRYYRTRGKIRGFAIGRPNTERRWVLYQGLEEPSKIPPEWHGWLHHIVDSLPKEAFAKGPAKKPYFWMKSHRPNLTGSANAYFPPGHIKAGAKREAATGDYQAWNPEN